MKTSLNKNELKSKPIIPELEEFEDFKELYLLMYYNDKELAGENEELPIKTIVAETKLKDKAIYKVNNKLEEHIHIMKQRNSLTPTRRLPNGYYSITRLQSRFNPEILKLDINILEFIYILFCLDNGTGKILKSDLLKFYSRPTISKYISKPELLDWIYIRNSRDYYELYYKSPMFRFLDEVKFSQQWKEVDDKYRLESNYDTLLLENERLKSEIIILKSI